MAEEKTRELLQKYLGISASRITIGILMIIFGIIILLLPELLIYLIALYLIINGILVIVDEYSRSKSVKRLASAS
ncbi:DUF3096 domain-containing protein [Thermogladius sp. 4427co]|uniref:DUF3096 domain-containing protein n=1 Tax=Thermogladius sp. 4427co TaxID=3450718 RepID=UPI003F79DEFF